MLGENREVSISCLILPSKNVEDAEDVEDTSWKNIIRKFTN